MARERRY